VCATWVCSTFVTWNFKPNLLGDFYFINWVQIGREWALSISIMMWLMSTPRARSHLHSVGPHSFSLQDLPTDTCVGTLRYWEPMWQYLIKIINMQVDITFIIPKYELHQLNRGIWDTIIFGSAIFFRPIQATTTNAKICSWWMNCMVGWYSLDYMWRGDIYERVSHPPQALNLTPRRFVIDSSQKQYRLIAGSLT
jgi:hypothetical protein